MVLFKEGWNGMGKVEGEGVVDWKEWDGKVGLGEKGHGVMY